MRVGYAEETTVLALAAIHYHMANATTSAGSVVATIPSARAAMEGLNR